MQAERGSEHKDALCYNSFTLPLGAQRRQGGGRTRLRGGQRQRERARRSKAKRGTSKLYDLRAQRSWRTIRKANRALGEANVKQNERSAAEATFANERSDGQRTRERARRSKAKRGTSKLYDLRAQRSGRMNQRAGAKRSEARASFTTCERIKEKRPLGRVN